MSGLLLVVDDSKTIRNSMVFILSNEGYEVVTAQDGEDAIKKLNESAGREHLPDMIITDINMAVMDGITFIKEIKKMPRFKSIPVLIMTTETEPEMKLEGKKAGAVGWLVKPFSPEQIIGVVEKIISRRCS